MKPTTLYMCLIATIFAAGFGPARATEHLMVIHEVFAATPSSPAAQYVMLRMTARGQTFLNGTYMELQDAAGAVLGRFGSFDHNMATAGALGCSWPTCPAIVIGTSAAQTLLSFTFDQIVDAQAGHVPLPQNGGRVCFKSSVGQAIDCIAWGSFSGANTIPTPTINACDANFGTPAAALSPGFALTRKQFNCAGKENSLDFENRFPHPVADSGLNANIDSDADGLISVLDCGDNDSTSLYAVMGVVDLAVVGGATASLSWSAESAPAGSSLHYDVSRFAHADLISQPSCDAAAGAGLFVGNGLTGLSLDDASLPAPNEIYYYALRSRNGCGPAPFC